MNSIEFTEQFLLKEVEAIEAANVRLHLLSAIVHGIETAGALLDDKPFKAKGQGNKRFGLALKTLFPARYSETNSKVNLYNFLRSHMAHSMLPAKQILLTNESKMHLEQLDSQLGIHLLTLQTDYLKAMSKLIELIESNQVKTKRIAFDNLEHL